MVPARLLFHKWRDWRLLSLPSDDGIVPDSKFWYSATTLLLGSHSTPDQVHTGEDVSQPCLTFHAEPFVELNKSTETSLVESFGIERVESAQLQIVAKSRSVIKIINEFDWSSSNVDVLINVTNRERLIIYKYSVKAGKKLLAAMKSRRLNRCFRTPDGAKPYLHALILTSRANLTILSTSRKYIVYYQYCELNMHDKESTCWLASYRSTSTTSA